MTIENHNLREYTGQDIDLDSIPYGNDRTGSLVGNLKSALDYLFASLYTQYIGTFATPAALPVSANANDYAFITDDGDGKSAGYTYIELDGVSSWQKKYDVDWNADGVLSDLLAQTNPLYVFLNGRDGGQNVYGGTSNTDELHLHGSAHADKTKIVVNDEFAPSVDNDISFGEQTKRIKDLFIAGMLKDGVSIELTLAQLKLAYDHISLTDNPHTVNYDQLDTKLGTITVDGHATGSVDLSSSGNKTLTINVNNDSHTHTKATLPNFDDDVWAKLKAIVQDNDIVTYTKDDPTQTIKPTIANISTARVTDIDSPTTKNKIVVTSDDETKYTEAGIGVEMTGDISGSGTYDLDTEKISITPVVNSAKLEVIEEIDYKSLGMTIGTHATDAPIFAPAHKLKTGVKVHVISEDSIPAINGEYIATVLDQDNFTIALEVTQAGTGYYIPNNAQLLYSSTLQKWITRREFEEVQLSEIGGLDEDVLTQYFLSEGRIGGQTAIGGTTDGDDLVLESTSHANKGKIVPKDNISPFTAASYSGGWSGQDIGELTKRFNDIFMAGQLYGLRLESVAANPPSSVQTKARLVWNETDEKAYIDTGVEYKLLSGANPPAMLETFATVETKIVDVSSIVEDTAEFNWLLIDDATNEIIHAEIIRSNTQELTINTDYPLTGTYKIKSI